MRKTLTINIDEELLHFTANCFSFDEKADYSQLIERVLSYFLKPLINQKKMTSIDENKISGLLEEPKIDIEYFEKNYHFDLSNIEGQWPGDEPLGQLLELISK